MRVKTVGCLYFSTLGFKNPLLALDISADLPELTRCPVALVSAGVKSILDIGRSVSQFISFPNFPDPTLNKCRTLEYLVCPPHRELWA